MKFKAIDLFCGAGGLSTGLKKSGFRLCLGVDIDEKALKTYKCARRRRYQVREITLDMAPNMEQIARICFPAAKRVTDRFHVQKLAYEAGVSIIISHLDHPHSQFIKNAELLQ